MASGFLYIMKLAVTILFAFISLAACSQVTTVTSPDRKVKIDLFNNGASNRGAWHLKVGYSNNGIISEAIERIDLGLLLNDQDFSDNLTLLKTGKPKLVKDEYTAVHGKRSKRSNTANELVLFFETPAKAKMNIVLRAYNDGIAFRYEFPDSQGSFVVKEELTSYTIPAANRRWMEKWNTANEGIYLDMKGDKVRNDEWCYPALVQSSDSSCWLLLHEADVDANYCGTKLSNVADPTKYKLTFPHQSDARGVGESNPTIKLPWKSPWRVVIIGRLNDIVESTLVDDVSTPSKVEDVSWIKPGLVSWNYWSNNHVQKITRLSADSPISQHRWDGHTHYLIGNGTR
jgi:alpha-glucosidase